MGMRKVEELEGALLDYWVAKAEGYRFWLEQRGQYRLAVRQGPGASAPYTDSRNWQEEKERYTEVFTFADISCGFFGSGVPRFSSDWSHGGPIIEREAITLRPVLPSGRTWYAMPDRDEWPDISKLETFRGSGPTPLIAAMRAYVASKFGSEVPDVEESHE